LLIFAVFEVSLTSSQNLVENPEVFAINYLNPLEVCRVPFAVQGSKAAHADTVSLLYERTLCFTVGSIDNLLQ
jgi:hypothetical protein